MNSERSVNSISSVVSTTGSVSSQKTASRAASPSEATAVHLAKGVVSPKMYRENSFKHQHAHFRKMLGSVL